MSIEIERKFLVNKQKWEDVKPSKGISIIQGYLFAEKEKTIRVRIKGKKGYLTIKGATESISRPEFEYEIPYKDAYDLLFEFCPQRIEKTRFEIVYKNHLWEVDEFLTPNPNLILAEIELSSENEDFSLPEWVDKEVTGLPEYYNSNMLTGN